jgi:hypothetical protein
MIITSWVDKYRVTQNQKSTIVLLNDFSSIIYQKLMLTEFWLVHKNTLSNQNIQFKVNIIRISPMYIWVLDSYDTLIVYLSCKIAQWS